MKILFFIPFAPDFDPQTPYERPLGGTESAVAYLSAELARAGATVTLLNPRAPERVVQGVRVVPPQAFSPDQVRSQDLVVVVSGAFGQKLRQSIGPSTPMVLWCHLMSDQPGVRKLLEQEEMLTWDGFVTVSRWQAERYHQHLGVSLDKVHVIGNAISPAFGREPLQPAWFETGAAPSLFYSSTPFRGLDRLLLAYPTIRAAVPDVTLKVFAGMALYGEDPNTDPYRYLYDLTRALPGADYVGPVPQQKLAEAYRDAAALAYPSNFEETSCITVMEAMASGADVLTTALGALPETLNGHGRMIAPTDLSKALVRTPFDILPYADMVIGALKEARANPAEAAARRAARAAYAREAYSWSTRAKQWIALAETLVARKRAA
ncbi:glycosyltransferase family 4 protein [Rhizobium paknamense]|uniref:Glycosyltransferase involved in cell wall biosynthesis n=1 Tax=Rhizobium paknamense TaxID=1206817 RepID=A0ABU0I9R9_9HYPH|nr:glycosyltransferase family 4 protein [Rhizobium paknamense]MDQ0454962.1 glycosyltransferase involved in cell wall biosynthesis [Rhizobium paknamense]